MSITLQYWAWQKNYSMGIEPWAVMALVNGKLYRIIQAWKVFTVWPGNIPVSGCVRTYFHFL